VKKKNGIPYDVQKGKSRERERARNSARYSF
jgi:hypothetical protein